MSTLIPENFETVFPSEPDQKLAMESSRLLASKNFQESGYITIQIDDGGNQRRVDLPASAMRLLLHLLNEMSKGNAVTLIPTHAELTTQQAADLLNVSRPYVVKLLDEGKIPSRLVGKFRRVRFDDVIAFKKRDDAAREKVLEMLSAETQKLEFNY